MAGATPTLDQLRNDVDSGGTADKVAFPDPATVPLGTDAEAGGNPPTKAELQQEAKRPKARVSARHDMGATIYPILVVGVAVVMITAVLLGGNA